MVSDECILTGYNPFLVFLCLDASKGIAGSFAERVQSLSPG